MNGTLRRGAVVLAALMGLAAGMASAQSTDSLPSGLRLTAGGGLGFGTGGVHAGTGDSKPGGTLLGRIGVAKNGRPFLVLDGEWQLYQAPIPFPADDTCEKANAADCPATRFDGVSVLAGVALFVTEGFYVLPQAGAQFRNMTGYRASEYSETGFAAGLNAGYLLDFGSGVSVSPEVYLRYAAMTGPDTPSFRAFGFRVMATWVF
jgi:hypothetical protein